MITVYGHTGMVGSQLYRWLKEHGANVAGVSLDKTDGDIEGNTWAFLCLPTLNVGHEQDQSAIWDVCDKLEGYVVIRSTILPTTCAQLRWAYPHLTIYHWPEFLSERTAYADFCGPKVRIVGGQAIEPWDREIEPLLPPAPVVHVSTETSETIKYAHNVHGAMEVIYANLMYDVCVKGGGSWEKVRELLPRLGYIAPEMAKAYWDVWKDGKRGYGGHCFPKDVQALADWHKSDLLDGMQRANEILGGGKR